MTVELEHVGCGGEVLMRLYPPCLFAVATQTSVSDPYLPVGEPVVIEEGRDDGGLYCVECHAENLQPSEVEVTGTTSRIAIRQETTAQV